MTTIHCCWQNFLWENFSCFMRNLMDGKKCISHLFYRTLNKPPIIGFDLLQFIEFRGNIIDGELQQVPEPGEILRGGSRHGAGVLKYNQTHQTLYSANVVCSILLYHMQYARLWRYHNCTTKHPEPACKLGNCTVQFGRVCALTRFT